MEKGTVFRRKLFNLDGPDVLQYYFHDTRKQTMSAIRRQMAGGSVMVRAGVGYFGKTSIKFIVGRMCSVRYINLIKEQINNHAELISGPDYIFQQDNAPVHTSRLVQSYFHENNISILPWPARSADLNIIIILKIAGQNSFTVYTRMEGGINTYNN